MSSLATVPSTFMGKFVQGLIEKEVENYIVPCDQSSSGWKFSVPDPSGHVLLDIRQELAKRAKERKFPEDRFDEYFEEYIAPVFHEVAPMVFAEVL